MMDHEPRRFWRSKTGIICASFLAIAGFFLITEHTAHVLGALPWLLLAACPVMHLFMHHGHGDQKHQAAPGVKPNDTVGSASGEHREP